MTPKCPDCKRDQDDCVCVDPQERIDELERENKRLSDDHYFQACLTRDLMPYQERAIKAEQKCDALQADNARLREALEYCVTQVGELATVPGIASALSSTPEQPLAEYRNKLIEECAKRAEAYAYMSQNFNALAEELRAMKEKP